MSVAGNYLRPHQRMAATHSMRPDKPAKAPTQQSAGGEEQGFFGQIGSAVMGGLQRVDDSTQAFARDHLLQLPTDGSRLDQDAFLSGPRQALGKSVFKARSGYEGDNTAYRGTGTTNDNIGLGLSRALQGGMITASGLALAQMTNQFGNAADYQEPNQLSL
jgi:hypothetical protein